MEVEQLVDQLPKRISNILEQVQSGQFDVKLDHRRLGPTAKSPGNGLDDERFVSWLIADAKLQSATTAVSKRRPIGISRSVNFGARRMLRKHHDGLPTNVGYQKIGQSGSSRLAFQDLH